jgi:hypothetical protein
VSGGLLFNSRIGPGKRRSLNLGNQAPLQSKSLSRADKMNGLLDLIDLNPRLDTYISTSSSPPRIKPELGAWSAEPSQGNRSAIRFAAGGLRP